MADLMTLTEVAEFLQMSRPNVKDFLDRHGLDPVVKTPRKMRWRRSDIEALAADYEASGRREADEKRRQAALRNVSYVRGG